MSHVLYRKYRSQTFDELVGQNHVTTLLKNAVAKGKISHAYLFYGPRGLGKTSTARILAKAVNCLQLKPDGNPCDKCKFCTAIREGTFLDLIEIDAASNRGIDQIRELKERIEFSPTEGKMKVYIIDEVHMLTTEAFNALLKTLEEPPEHAIFILATTEIHKVPATILSRCQRFDFRLGSDKEMRELLTSIAKEEGVVIDDGAMKLMIENARGSYRDALSLLDVVISGQMADGDTKRITEEEVIGALGLADSTMVYFFLEKIVNGQASEALDLVQELSQKGVNLGQFLKFVLSVLREILVALMRGEVGNLEYSFAEQLDRQKTLKLINLCVDAERSLRDALVPSLPLELLVADSMDIFGTSNKGKEMESGIAPKGGKGRGDAGGDSKKTRSFIGRVLGDKAKKLSSRIENSVKSKETIENKDVSKVELESISSRLTLTEDELKKKWVEVLRGLRPYNSHLYAFVGRAQVKELTDGVLTLAVAFDFHKDRIESSKSREAIANVFKTVFGCPIKLNCVLDSSIRPSRVSADNENVIIEEAPARAQHKSVADIYNSVADVFGDELVSVS